MCAPRAPRACPWRIVVWRHALRNALIPIITVVGLYLGILIGNSVLTEIVFNRPGPRQADRRRAQPARLHDAAGPDGDLHPDRRAGEHADRPRLRPGRSAGEAAMSAAAMRDRAAPRLVAARDGAAPSTPTRPPGSGSCCSLLVIAGRDRRAAARRRTTRSSRTSSASSQPPIGASTGSAPTTTAATSSRA